ncbi:helix-turn-helix domain-containing protein [Lucifera butyrica]|uniref:helix-turn-helix domain-containing protein n=1 Tax=Lucifera butyrica TaxID=1351585 RepID=UPI000F01EC7A
MKGWSQQTSSEASGVSRIYLPELEADKKQPTVLVMQKIAIALEVNAWRFDKRKVPSRPSTIGGGNQRQHKMRRKTGSIRRRQARNASPGPVRS